jgi:hypothetical protein
LVTVTDLARLFSIHSILEEAPYEGSKLAGDNAQKPLIVDSDPRAQHHVFKKHLSVFL